MAAATSIVPHTSNRGNIPTQSGLVRTVVENAVTLHQYVGPQQRTVEDPTNLYMLKDQAIEIIELRAELSKMESTLQRSRIDHAHTKRLLDVCQDQSKLQLQSLHNRAKMMEGEVQDKEMQIQQILGEFQEKERLIHDSEHRERQAQGEIRQLEQDTIQLENAFNHEMQQSFEAENNARLFLEKLRDLEHSYRELVIRYEETKGMKTVTQKLVKAVPVATKSEKQKKKEEKKEKKEEKKRVHDSLRGHKPDEFQTPIDTKGQPNGFPPAPAAMQQQQLHHDDRFDHRHEANFNSRPHDPRQQQQRTPPPTAPRQDSGRSPHDDYDDDFAPRNPDLASRNPDNQLDFSRGQVTGYEV